MDEADEEAGALLSLTIPSALAGERLDRVLAEVSGLSRARVQGLMAEGALTPFAPAFHIIDHVIYHTTLDTPELVPAVGLTYSARAFLKVLDESHGMTMAGLRGTAKLPNPLQ